MRCDCTIPPELLGVLGRLTWVRCKACHAEWPLDTYDAFGAEVEAELGCEPGELEGIL